MLRMVKYWEHWITRDGINYLSCTLSGIFEWRWKRITNWIHYVEQGSWNSCFSESFIVLWNKAGQKTSMHCTGFQSGVHSLVPLFAGNGCLSQCTHSRCPSCNLVWNKSTHILWFPNESSQEDVHKLPSSPNSIFASASSVVALTVAIAIIWT